VLRVEEATVASVELTAAVGRLVGQLSAAAQAPTVDELRELVDSPATRLLVARDEHDRVDGLLTLALFRVPTGLRAWVEDVVVDERARRKGVAETLIMEALRLAQGAGATTVEITTRDNEAPDRLVRRLGFKQQKTGVYRHELRPKVSSGSELSA
jgi:ribosomal protein S18 acetylase RimI-like enzyme